MKICIDEKVLELFSEASIGAMRLSFDLINQPEKIFRISDYKDQIINQVISEYSDLLFEDIPQIKCWMNIFNKMNVKKGRESSIVFLTRYVLENKGMFSINPIVDLYNAVSLKYGIPMGGYDFSKIEGNIYLRTAKKGEEFCGIGSKQIEKTSANEIVYADSKGVFCRCWNDKDGDRTKLQYDTKDVLYIFDGINQQEILSKIFQEISDLLDIKITSSCVIDHETTCFEM